MLKFYLKLNFESNCQSTETKRLAQRLDIFSYFCISVHPQKRGEALKNLGLPGFDSIDL